MYKMYKSCPSLRYTAMHFRGDSNKHTCGFLFRPQLMHIQAFFLVTSHLTSHHNNIVHTCVQHDLYCLDIPLLRFTLLCSTNIWHGINPWGEPSHFDCEDWNSEDPLHVGLTSDPSVGILSHQKKMSCNNRFHILCIETT